MLTGCANPYVKLGALDTSKAYTATTLPAAFDYTRSAHRQYRDKVIELGDAERNLSNGLITLGAVILALAVSKTHSSVITGATIAGGTAYTLGTFNTDKRRAMIYIAGMKAFECAMDVVTPLNLGNDVLHDVKAKVLSVDRSIALVAQRMSEVEAAIQRAQQGGGDIADVVKGARDGIDNAQATIGRANQATSAANQLLIQHSQAGEQLLRAVDKIDRAVLDELRGTEAAIQAVPGIIAGLAKNNEFFAAAGKLPDTGTQGTKSETPMAGFRLKGAPNETALAALISAIASLKSAVVLLDSGAERLRGFVVGIEQKTPFESLKACKVEGLKTAITVSPQSVSFIAKTPSTQTILIDGGNNNYRATFLQRPTPGLSVEVPARSKGVVEIVATDKTEAGNRYQLLVEDTTGQSNQIIVVEIKDKDKPTPDLTSAASSTLAPVQGILESLGTIDVAGAKVTIQKPVTINPGNKSLAVTYTVEAGKSVTDEQVRDALFARDDIRNKLGDDKTQIVAAASLADAPHAGVRRKVTGSTAWGEVVRNLDRQQIALVQSRLCLPIKDVDGIWGDQTQAALRAYRAQRRASGAGEGIMLTEQEARLLLNMSAAQVANRCGS